MKIKYLINVPKGKENLWLQFKAKCALNGKSMIQVLFELIESYVKK